MEVAGVADEKGKCFVIMPISDPDGYDKGHFESVYKDIFAPAIEKAGYTPHRVDEGCQKRFDPSKDC